MEPLVQWFSVRGNFAPRGDTWQCLGTFLVVTMSGLVPLIPGDAASHSTVARIVPTAKNYPAPNVNGAEVEKPCFSLTCTV